MSGVDERKLIGWLLASPRDDARARLGWVDRAGIEPRHFTLSIPRAVFTAMIAASREPGPVNFAAILRHLRDALAELWIRNQLVHHVCLPMLGCRDEDDAFATAHAIVAAATPEPEQAA